MALDIILRIMEEIKDRYKLEDEIPRTPVQLENDLSSWLAKVQKEKLILIIDSLDRLSPLQLFCTGFRILSRRMSGISSSAGGQTLDVLERRGMRSFMSNR